MPRRDDVRTAATDPPDAGDFDAVVAEIEAFVAAERGLPFEREVTVELADDTEFEQRLLEDFDEDAADLAVAGRVLQAVGLVEPGTDVVAAPYRLLGAGVVGFYDPATDELVVRGTSTSPYVRSVIAHELTHALDDQHFELDRPAVDEAADESAFGFTGLVEGNAVRAEQAYRDTFTEEEAEDAPPRSCRSAPASIRPRAPRPTRPSPPPAARTRAGACSTRGASRASTPPPSHHQRRRFDPPTFLAGQTALPVPAPLADGPEIDRNVLGSLGLLQVLGDLTFLLGGLGSLPDSVAGVGRRPVRRGRTVRGPASAPTWWATPPRTPARSPPPSRPGPRRRPSRSRPLSPSPTW